MSETRFHIHTMFQNIQPEILLASIVGQNRRESLGAQGIPYDFSSDYVPMDCYIHGARSMFHERSDDELRQFYWDLYDYLYPHPSGGLFSLLADYAQQSLCFYGSYPVCRLEWLLEWRELSLDLGQDLLVCAGIARQDVENSRIRSDFCWPIAVRTDDRELNSILRRGLAENHFHLNGSTQGFPLTWGFLMNHPEQAGRYFSKQAFRDNMSQQGGWGAQDNMLPWKVRIYYAAWLRATLFSQLQTRGQAGTQAGCKKDVPLIDFYYALNQCSMVRALVDSIRFLYGARLRQSGGRQHCLDYAIDAYVDQRRSTRFLSGERRFLYHCFRQSFTGGFSSSQKNAFYLYLLLKQCFRREIIQTNRRYGFRNFSSYTGRKDQIWGWRNDYWFEANHLAINATLEQPISSLEMRITPGKNAQDLVNRIDLPDQVSQFELDSPLQRPLERRQKAIDQDRTFFVLHFAKNPMPRLLSPPPPMALELRHGKYRRQVEQQAKTVAASLERSNYLCARIRGIDAASHEIGCRPEIFGTSFRFLRHFSIHSNLSVRQERYWPVLGASYHVGEDFLDIADGLRAIDEAVCFLNLDRGDRLGHALALGIAPEEYYRIKRYYVLLPAQDLLDNLVWILFRSLEWGLPVPGDLRYRLSNRAEALFRKIYGNRNLSATLQEYFQSWMLRGDSPELYFSYNHSNDAFDRQLRLLQYSASSYDTFRVNHLQQLENYRSQHRVRELVHRYQYGMYERWLGQQNESFTIDGDYIHLMREIQEYMMRRLMDCGVCIECNPSSNYLIGTFRQYEHHPIFRFNRYNLDLSDLNHSGVQMQVSINTDDQSVFDTSLEYEYALLYRSMRLHMDEHGKPKISNDAAIRYLEHVRNMGLTMTFEKGTKELMYRFSP